MSNPYTAAYPYHDDTFRKRCPHCAQTNQVSVTKQDGQNESEEYYCANCRRLLGTARASNTPHTMIVADEAGEDATNQSDDEGTAQKKIEAAAAATDAVQDLVDRDLTALQSSFNGRITNGYGVYASSSQQQATLRGAIESLSAALQQMQDTPWPTSADYDAA